jgi:hypothetical protein
MAANDNNRNPALSPRRATTIPGQTRTGSAPLVGAIVERVSPAPAQSDADQGGDRADTLHPELPAHAGTLGFQLPPFSARGDGVQPRARSSC